MPTFDFMGVNPQLMLEKARTGGNILGLAIVKMPTASGF